MLLCGKIVNTHGLGGEVKVLPYADHPSFFDSIHCLCLADGTRLTLQGYRPQKGALLFRFAEINTIEKAEALRGQALYVERQEAPPLPEGRFYIVDIIGLSVVTDTGRELGHVTEVLQTGSNDVYVVRGDKEYLIPVIDEVVLEVNPSAGLIRIKPLEGLLDDED
ncbi:MAG: ribosome maturation factor RimM [Clostridia bacterium]|nr:ribosome maturation factor RimM [Clostridia bacterium]